MRERSWWVPRHRQRNPYVLDVAIAVIGGALALVAFLAAEPMETSPRPADLFGGLLVVAAWGVLTFRRRDPVRTWVVAVAVCTVFEAMGYGDGLVWVASVIALASVAARTDRTTTLTATGLTVAASILTAVINHQTSIGDLLGGAALICSVAVWGDRKAVRAAYFEQLELRAAEKERERIEAADRAVGAERVRIARELHDVVAHAMSVVAVQSGVGAHVIERDPVAAKRILETISDTSRDALGEMRRMLGVLRDDSGEPVLAPAPGLSGLDELVARVGAAGVPVEVHVSGDLAGLAPGLDLAAYRIVQEALTNVLKHAGPARACVEVRVAPDEVALTVSDDGRGPLIRLPDPAPGAGHGIVGMRERAALYGGELRAGPRPEGGFLVTAVLRPAAAPAPAGAPAGAGAAGPGTAGAGAARPGAAGAGASTAASTPVSAT